MKVTKHAKSGKPTTLDLAASPLRIWLSRELELKIEKGDKLSDVARIIEQEWGLKPKRALQLAAMWFALGERQINKQHDAPWQKKELSPDPARRYCQKSKR